MSAASASGRPGSMLWAIANCSAAASGFAFDSKSLPAAKWATYRLSRKSSAEGLISSMRSGKPRTSDHSPLAPLGIELID
jgi:hypothetical protein